MDRKQNYIQIGQRIRNVREAKGLTQTQLGDRLRVPITATAISLYEKGDREVSVDVLAEIANKTEVSVEYLATGKLEGSPPIQVALRADKDLWKNEAARTQVLDFIEFIKKKSSEGENK
ncbi:MAG TPA: hypothetical protein DEP85_06170 [Holosporales bacterium]|nr:hypothetical protein [Holosporales bacterium]